MLMFQSTVGKTILCKVNVNVSVYSRDEHASLKLHPLLMVAG